MISRKMVVVTVSIPLSISALILAGCYVLVRTWTDPRGRLDDIEDYFGHLRLLPALLRAEEVILNPHHIFQPE